jgi:hypothetical protein
MTHWGILRKHEIIQTNILILMKNLTHRKLLTLRRVLNLLNIFVVFRTNELFGLGKERFYDFAVLLVHLRALW